MPLRIPKKITRLLRLLGCIAVAATAAAQTNTLVNYGSNGKLVYTPNSRGDVIPDFSGVGYMNGEQEIPNVPIRRTLSAISGDNRAQIQAAIDELEALPLAQRGAIYFNAGTYNISGTLTVNASGIVLRGAGTGTSSASGPGTGGTRFIATSTAGNDGNKTALIRFSGGGVSTSESTRKAIVGSPVSGQSYTYVPLGTKQFTVQSGHTFQVGDWVYLTHTPNQAWINLLGMDDLTNPWTPSGYDYDMERKVVAVSGNLITLDAPNMDPIDSRYATASLVEITSTRIEQCGVENIYFESVYNASEEYLNPRDDRLYKSDEDHTWKAVEFGPIKNAWARNLHARFFAYSCVYIESEDAVFITVDNCKMFQPVSMPEGGRKYSFANEGQRNLVMNCYAERGRHDYASGSNSRGPNVYYNCEAEDPVINCDSGPHHRWTAGALYDRVWTEMDINVQNRLNSGSGHGWGGAQIMLWNCRSRKTILQSPPAPFESWAIGHIGTVTKDGQYTTSERLGVVQSQGTHITAIPSLYLAQLTDRLGGVAAAAPQFTPAPGAYTSAQSVTIASATPNTTIRYTTDGSTPSVTSGTVYSGPVALATPTTLKAIAYGGNADPSTVVTGNYDFLLGGTTVTSAQNFVNLPLPSSQTGTFTLLFDTIPSTTDASIGLCLNDQASYAGLALIVRFNSAGMIDARNGGAYAASSIAYTSGTRYSFRLVVNVTNRTYSAYVTPSGGSEQTIGTNFAFRTEQAGVTSLNRINIDANNGSIVVGQAVIPGAQAATPTFSPDGGTHTDSVAVTIASATSGTSIRYTLDGSTPTSTTGALYTGPVTITSSATLKAVAYGTGYTTSAVKSSAYTLLQTAAAPTFTPPAGTYTATTNVTLATTSSGASIRYTTNGSDPTPSTGTIYVNPIAVSSSQTLKAIAYGTGYAASAVSSAAYTIDNGSSTVTDAQEFFNRAMPSAQSGTFNITFSATPSTTDATIGLCLGNQTAYTGLATIVRFNTAGRIDARNGGAYAAANVITYTSGTTYTFRLAVDVPTRRYSIYVTPAGGTEQVVGLNYAFRTEQAAVTSLDTMNIDANSGSIVVSTATISNVVPASTWDFAGPQTFNGTTDYVAGTTSSGSASSLTIAFWATPSQLASMGVVDKLPLTGTAGWSLKMRSNGDLWFRIGSEAAGSRTDVIATAVYSANTPVHIACTFSGGTGKIYVNGVLRTTLASIAQTVNNTTTTLRLGIPSAAATGNIYAGVLENVKIFHQELTLTQIQSLMLGP